MIVPRQRIFFFVAMAFLLPLAAWAGSWQAVDEGLDTRFSMELKSTELRPGAVTTLTIGFQIEDGWYVEGPTSENAPLRVQSSDDTVLQILGPPSGPEGKRVFDEVLEKNLVKHVGEVHFIQRVRVNPEVEAGTHEVKLRVEGQTCNKGSCRKLRKVMLASSLTIAGTPVAANSTDEALLSGAGDLPDDGTEPVTSAWTFLLACFLGGLAMLLLPCVWPMIPITISIFVKHSEEHKTGALFYALIYGFGIVASFGLIGLAIGFWLPPSYAQSIATSGPLNLLIGILFVAFALSFFGMFELKLPDFIQRRMPQGNAGQGMVVASLLMGVLFTVTSFACTAPIMGTILVAGTSTGDKWLIPMGMAASGLGVAIPFVALAMFPSTLKRMPRAGGWMNTIKVVLGFVEMAAALKFLSNADLAWDTQILTWPVFMCLWIAIMFGLSFYLFGWVRMGHDDGDGRVSAGRFTMGMLVAGMGMYLVFGLFHPEEPMPSVVAAMTPPHEYGRPHLKNLEAVDGEPTNALFWYDDWDKASAAAIKANKAIFVDFTGVQCTNCRLVEKRVFPRVEETLRKFVVVKLYTDYGPSKSRNIELRDRYSRDLPYYVVLSPDTKTVLARQRYTDSPKTFQAFLDKGLSGFAKVSGAGGETVAPPDPGPRFVWHQNLNEAQAAQKESKTPLFVAFGGTGCVACEEMYKTVFKEAAVEEIFGRLTLSKLDTWAGDDADNYAEFLNESAGTYDVPAYVLYGVDGKVIATLKGKNSAGAFLNFLKRAEAP